MRATGPIKHLLIAALLGVAAAAAPAAGQSGGGRADGSGARPERVAWCAEDEVFYQIFVRSFRDSDGDRIGDLNGVREALGYVRELGATSILLTPINPSPFYHNYFATSFEGVDRAYGDARSLHALIEAVHGRGMKIYLDVEVQYLAGGHPWWKESEGNPGSRYSRFLIYHGRGNTQPDTAAFNLLAAPGYDGKPIRLTTVNLLEPAVRSYFQRFFLTLVDPSGDGRFDDGVDGFRLDHMMDNLDNRGELTHLFADFWAPIIGATRAANPRVRFIAEQGDWGPGDDFLTRGGADMVFAFPLRAAVASLKRNAIADALTAMIAGTPAGKGRLIFIENHDVTRFASEVGGDPRKERIGAALTVLLKGTPLMYYGQELGMKGRQTPAWSWGGGDIPQREAFRWDSRVESRGSATWYSGDYPWWTGRFARDHDGISVAEERGDTGSLLSFYRRLLAQRRSHPELRAGDERVLDTNQADVLAVLRSTATGAGLLLVNFADTSRVVAIGRESLPTSLVAGPLRDLVSGRPEAMTAGTWHTELPALAVKLLVPGR